MYDEHHQEHQDPVTPSLKGGYNAVQRPGSLDDPQNRPPRPQNFYPAWRHNVDETKPYIVTDDKYFQSALDDANIALGHPYENWGPIASSLRFSFLNIYGKNGTKTPADKMSECRSAFIAVAKSTVADYLDYSGQHTHENRARYRGLIQQLTWVRTGNLKP